MHGLDTPGADSQVTSIFRAIHAPLDASQALKRQFLRHQTLNRRIEFATNVAHQSIHRRTLNAIVGFAWHMALESAIVWTIIRRHRQSPDRLKTHRHQLLPIAFVLCHQLQSFLAQSIVAHQHRLLVPHQPNQLQVHCLIQRLLSSFNHRQLSMHSSIASLLNHRLLHAKYPRYVFPTSCPPSGLVSISPRYILHLTRRAVIYSCPPSCPPCGHLFQYFFSVVAVVRSVVCSRGTARFCFRPLFLPVYVYPPSCPPSGHLFQYFFSVVAVVRSIVCSRGTARFRFRPLFLPVYVYPPSCPPSGHLFQYLFSVVAVVRSIVRSRGTVCFSFRLLSLPVYIYPLSYPPCGHLFQYFFSVVAVVRSIVCSRGTARFFESVHYPSMYMYILRLARQAATYSTCFLSEAVAILRWIVRTESRYRPFIRLRPSSLPVYIYPPSCPPCGHLFRLFLE